MSEWSKHVPTAPGFYWARMGKFGPFIFHRDGDKNWWEHGSEGAMTRSELSAYEFGPAIPSAEAIEKAKEALRGAANLIDCIGTTDCDEELVKDCRAALAALENEHG